MELALKPLPISDLFLSALQDDGDVDESGLDQWDLPPPYANSQELSSSNYAVNLVDVVHGRHMRADLKEGRHRMEVHRQKPRFRGVRQATLTLERAAIEGYEAVTKLIEEYGCDSSYTSGLMTRHFLQWSARRVYDLHEEIQALTSGRDSYEKLYNSRYCT